MSSIGLVACTMFALDVVVNLLVPETASWYAAMGDLDTVGMTFAPAALVGIVLGVVALLMARRSGDRASAARLAVVFGLLGVVLQVVTYAFILSALFWHDSVLS